MGSRSTLAVTFSTVMVAVAALTAAAQPPSATPMQAATFTATSDLDPAVGYTESVTGSEDGATRVRADFATIWDATDPYHYAEVRGTVVETVRGAEARAHIDALSQKYRGRDYDPAAITSGKKIASGAGLSASWTGGKWWLLTPYVCES